MKKPAAALLIAAVVAVIVAGRRRSPPVEDGIIVVNQHQIQFTGSPESGWRVVDWASQYDESGKTLDSVLQPAIDLAMMSP